MLSNLRPELLNLDIHSANIGLKVLKVLVYKCGAATTAHPAHKPSVAHYIAREIGQADTPPTSHIGSCEALHDLRVDEIVD